MFRPKDFQEKISHRLKISLGQLKKVVEMVDNDEYCIDVLHQSQAVQKALKEVDILMLEHHLKTCATDAVKQGKELEAIKEVIEVFKKSK